MAKKIVKAKAAAKKPAPAKKAGASASAKAKKPAKPASSGKKAAKPVPSKATASKKKPVSKPTVKASAKPASKAASKPTQKSKSKPAAKSQPAKKVSKPTKPVGKPAPKPAAKATTKPASKPAAKVEVKTVAKPAVKPAVKAPVKPEPKPVAAKKEVEAPKATPKPEAKKPVSQPQAEAPAKKEVEKAVASAPAVSPEVSPKKEAIKTVEQQIQEKNQPESAASKGVASKQKEELYVPKYQLPSTGEVARPMRPKPPVPLTDAPAKPVANPIYVPPAPDGKPGIKFAPIAIVEKPKEKEKPNKSEEDEMSSKTSPRLALNDGDDKKGVSVEAKLRALYGIQLIDSRIDRIHAMRGELPLEVQDLEDDVAGLEARIENVKADLKNVNEEISGKKNGIKNSEALIKKYKEQLNNVKNNREFDSLNKEIEFQELEIQLHNKRIREFEITQKTKQDLLDSTEAKLTERKSDLKVKKAELDDIVSSTEKEEKVLRQKSEEAKKLIEVRLLAAYERIRTGAPNGMAVVPIEREASAGSFIQLPPQKQLDVAARKRVIVDEHSGRILVDADLAREEQEKMDAVLAKELH